MGKVSNFAKPQPERKDLRQTIRVALGGRKMSVITLCTTEVSQIRISLFSRCRPTLFGHPCFQGGQNSRPIILLTFFLIVRPCSVYSSFLNRKRMSMVWWVRRDLETAMQRHSAKCSLGSQLLPLQDWKFGCHDINIGNIPHCYRKKRVTATGCNNCSLFTDKRWQLLLWWLLLSPSFPKSAFPTQALRRLWCFWPIFKVLRTGKVRVALGNVPRWQIFTLKWQNSH